MTGVCDVPHRPNCEATLAGMDGRPSRAAYCPTAREAAAAEGADLLLPEEGNHCQYQEEGDVGPGCCAGHSGVGKEVLREGMVPLKIVSGY